MVQLTSTLLLALAASATEAHRRHERRGYNDAHAAAHYHKRHDMAGTGSVAPYPAGNATAAAEGTGTVTELTTYSTTTVAVTTYVTVEPKASGAAAGAGSGSGSGSGSGAGGAPAADQCGPATVTITAPANTVTVTTTVGETTTSGTTTSAAAAYNAPTPAAQPAAEKPAAAEEHPAQAAPAAKAKPQEHAAEDKTPETHAAAQPAQDKSQDAKPAAAQPAAKKAEAPKAPSKQPKVPVYGSNAAKAVGGGKRGVGYDSPALLGAFANSGVSWAHNWHMSTEKMGLQYIPTLKDKSQLGDFEQKCQAAIAAGSPALFTFNEPDMVEGAGGSNMSPDEAAALYKKHVNPFAGKIALGSPSVTSHNATSGATGGPSGMVWLQKFADACAGNCHVDFVNLHFYGGAEEQGADTAKIFKQYITAAKAQVKAMFGKDLPVWMTEFSAIPTADKGGAAKNADFLSPANGVIDFLEENCDKYAFFMASANNLVTDAGSLTELGKKYAA